jgi:hypothetical protein
MQYTYYTVFNSINCTFNGKYLLFCDAPKSVAPAGNFSDINLQRTAFLINAVQDKHVWS